MAEARRRIAVVLSQGYRGGVLRGAKLVAEALWIGSRQAGEEAEILLAYPEPVRPRGSDWERDMPPGVSTRAFEWKTLDASTAARIMRYAGRRDWQPSADAYLIAEDGMHQFMDCDLCLIVSDRLTAPLLPLRGYALLAYDYVQRYHPEFADNRLFIEAARRADRVFATTRFTEKDILGFAGIAREKVVRLPQLMPEFHPESDGGSGGKLPRSLAYFLWSTNPSAHKNHENAALALQRYYEVLDGQLECHLTGPLTGDLLSSGAAHLKTLVQIVSGCKTVSRRLKLLGELPESRYRRELQQAAFLWHPGRIDNGTFSVVEAAWFGVPSLSSRYPAMEEMNDQFQLSLCWMDAHEPGNMAGQLKWMETHAALARESLPPRSVLRSGSASSVAAEYWSAIRECL